MSVPLPAKTRPPARESFAIFLGALEGRMLSAHFMAVTLRREGVWLECFQKMP